MPCPQPAGAVALSRKAGIVRCCPYYIEVYHKMPGNTSGRQGKRGLQAVIFQFFAAISASDINASRPCCNAGSPASGSRRVYTFVLRQGPVCRPGVYRACRPALSFLTSIAPVAVVFAPEQKTLFTAAAMHSSASMASPSRVAAIAPRQLVTHGQKTSSLFCGIRKFHKSNSTLLQAVMPGLAAPKP